MVTRRILLAGQTASDCARLRSENKNDMFDCGRLDLGDLDLELDLDPRDGNLMDGWDQI